MRLFKRKTTKEDMLAAVARARARFQSMPGSKGVMMMDEALKRIEGAYADGKER